MTKKKSNNETKPQVKMVKKIKKALEFDTVKGAALSLINSKLPGNTLIFNKDNMYLLEGSWVKGEYATKKYNYKIQKIPRDQIVARTNHGIWLNKAGYQRNRTKSETLSRISSESRLSIAEVVGMYARTPEDMLDGLTQNFTNNGQLNALRTSTKQKKMRTTAQIMIIPKENTMYVRPVQSHMMFNFWELNHPKQQTWVELLSNRILYLNLKDPDPENDPPFSHNLNHTLD